MNSSSPLSFPSFSSAPPPPLPSPPSHSQQSHLLTDADHATLQRQMDDVQALLLSLPASQQQQHLLSRLLAAYEQQLISVRQAEHWRKQCGRVRQRLTELRADIDKLQDEIEEQTDVQHSLINGKEEKQSNGHHYRQQQHSQQPHHSQPHNLSTIASSPRPLDTAADFTGFSDYSTLLAATEAALEVERRQRESQQPHQQQQRQQYQTSLSASTTLHSSPSVTSSPHYHHDHTLTAAGKQLVRAMLSLVSPTGSLNLTQLQRLCECTGRLATAAVGGGDDDSGDVWWVWQSYASESEDGEQGMRQADMEQLYEQEWDVDEDGKRLGLV